MSERARPLGRWVGAGSWHPLVSVTAPPESTCPGPGERLEVDEDLANVLVELWRRGIPTYNSCQDAPSTVEDGAESGEAHIHFATVEAAEQVAGMVGAAAMLYHAPGTRPDTMCVAFPVAEIGRLERRLAADVSSR